MTGQINLAWTFDDSFGAEQPAWRTETPIGFVSVVDHSHYRNNFQVHLVNGEGRIPDELQVRFYSFTGAALAVERWVSEMSPRPQSLFLVQKRGYYYRPEARGYTAFKKDAGRWPLEDVAMLFSGMSERSGLSFISEDMAEDYSPACDEITRLRHMAGEHV